MYISPGASSQVTRIYCLSLLPAPLNPTTPLLISLLWGELETLPPHQGLGQASVLPYLLQLGRPPSQPEQGDR